MQSNDTTEIQISFLSVECTEMKSKDVAYIFYFTVKNLSPKRAKLFATPRYTTQEGEEIDLDAWLNGMGNGGTGFTLSKGTFKKIGCVYFDSKLNKLTNGDKLLLTAWIDNGSGNHEFIFECIDATNKKYQLLSSSLVPRVVVEDKLVSPTKPIEQKKEITKIIERLELLEEKFGITISGLYATCRYELYGSPPYHEIFINFDVTSLSGGKLERCFYVSASAYNSAGQLLETTRDYINADVFMGLQSISIKLYVGQAPEKIRLFLSA